MKLSIYGQRSVGRAFNSLPEVELSLVQGDGEVIVQAGDDELLYVSENGTIERAQDVSTLGFKLGPNNTILRSCHRKVLATDTPTLKFMGEYSTFKTNGMTRDWQLALQPYKDGSLRLVAIGSNGKRILNGNLVKFKPDGTLYFYHTVEPDLGFTVDGEGRIVNY